MKELKDLPIKLPDGTEVKLGNKIYSVRTYTLNDPRYAGKIEKNKHYSTTGTIRNFVKSYDIIRVNQASNSRSFVIRSKTGCEYQHSVKDKCVPENYFGTKANALKKVKSLNNEDLDGVQEKISFYEEKLKLWKECKAKLKKNMSK